ADATRATRISLFLDHVRGCSLGLPTATTRSRPNTTASDTATGRIRNSRLPVCTASSGRAWHMGLISGVVFALARRGSGMFASLRGVLSDQTPGLRPKLMGVAARLIASTLLLWGAALATAARYPAVLAFAVAAYLLGLRHAVDADHIAAIDTVTRKLMQEHKRPVGVGFFFSLGHSTVVVLIALLVGLGAKAISAGIHDDHSALETTAGLIGTSVSAVFLLAMALINLVILAQIVRAFRQVTRGGVYDA